MQYNFFIHNDKLIFNDHVNPRTGSVNVYECVFNINESVKGLQWFCVFNTEGVNAIVTPIINNSCFIPVEVLKDEKNIDIGCYATNGNTEDFKRINTNWLTFRPTKGAYMEGEAPETPSPDFWETLIFKTVPYIGSNGNWFIYDMESGQYKDTGKPSSGMGGGSVDLSNYYTKDEIDVLASEFAAGIIDHSYSKGYINDHYYDINQVDDKLSDKADKANTYTKQDIDELKQEIYMAISDKANYAWVASNFAGIDTTIDELVIRIGYIDSTLDEIISLQIAKGGDAV